MGGTCVVDLTAMHPELFSSFVDIAGDLGPAAGTKAQTIARLFGGNATAWAAFDPLTVITKHGRYHGVSGWFAISNSPQKQRIIPDLANNSGSHRSRDDPGGQTDAANTLCGLGKANGITCAVIAAPGQHTWQFAEQVFASSLPWLAGQIGVPGVARNPLPEG
jgi:S-formylglutathione hydrolase FrmB